MKQHGYRRLILIRDRVAATLGYVPRAPLPADEQGTTGEIFRVTDDHVHRATVDRLTSKD